MADLREDFVKYVVGALVTNPSAISLKRSEDEKGEYLELQVDPADMGKIIGKAGATAKSIRTLLRGVGAKDNLAPLALKIVDPEGSAPPAAEAPVETPVETHEAAPTPVEAAEEAPAEEEQPGDEQAERMKQTKREAEELADLEL